MQELVSGITASGKWLDEGDERLLEGLVMESAASKGSRASGLVEVPDEFGRSPRLQAAMIARNGVTTIRIRSYSSSY